MARDLLCVGSIVADISVSDLDRFPSPDHEFTERSDIWHDSPARLLLGGTAANSAIVYAALRGACRLAGPVGTDPLGQFLVAILAERGVHVEGERASSTSTHMIAVGRDGRRQSDFYSGPDMDLDGLALGAGAPHLYFTGMNLVMKRPIVDPLRRAAQTAKAEGSRAVLDIGPPVGEPLSISEFTALGDTFDLIVGSRHEFESLTGLRYPDSRSVIRRSYGGPYVVKLGSDGCDLIMSDDEAIRIPPCVVAEVNPIGAGDAFVGGLLASWLGGSGLREACEVGCAAGAASVSSPEGPQSVTGIRVGELLAGRRTTQ